MRVLMVCEKNLPIATGGGPKMNQWAITEELRARGHRVNILYITKLTRENEYTPQDFHDIYALISRGVCVTSLNYNAGITPGGVSEVIAHIKPDVITGLGTWQIAWAGAYNRMIPRVCIVGDPEHVIESYRVQLENYNKILEYEEIASIHNRASMKKDSYLPLLAECQYTFCTAQQSTKWFNNTGLEDMEYLPMPIVDPVFPGWRRRKEDMPQNPKPRILLAGHLTGMATLSSLYYLVDHVLPYMDDIDDYDWNICGGDDLLPDLETKFKKYPQIKFRGYVEDIRKEILQADIFLCTTAFPVGVRTRLAEAMALGSCIVAHSANGLGQPEFENGVNVVLGDTGQEIAEYIQALAGASNQRYEMGHAARKTFEEKFCTAKSAGRVVDKMEEVCQ